MPTLVVGMLRFARTSHAHDKRGHGTRHLNSFDYFTSALSDFSNLLGSTRIARHKSKPRYINKNIK
jgi:hypothetical protein